MSTDLMNPGEVETRVLRIIADNQRKDVSLLSMESSFEELGIDSMDAVNIVFALENEFNINVPDEEMKNIRSVRDIVEGVHKLVRPSRPTGRKRPPPDAAEGRCNGYWRD